MSKLISRSRGEITQGNIIPIGILNTESTFLTEKQIEENIYAKANKLNIDFDKYEIIPIKMAGFLQDEIYQGNVSFEINPELYINYIDDPIEKIQIDFQDEKGWQSFDFKYQLIEHQFYTTGTVAIGIKIITKNGSFLTFCPLNIKLVERPKEYLKASVEVDKVRFEDTKDNKNAKIAAIVTGGEYAIYNGCDNIFDKPIIIAEGFDVGQDVDITVMISKYYPYLYALRNNGYDLVFVNYNNGQDFIENNAEVLKRVINEVNALKVGTEKLTVIGESMSGLVARYAIRTMELAGLTHQVGHFVSFDSPQKGANIPEGLMALRRYVPTAAWPWTLALNNLNVLFNIVPELNALESPAAKQLLLSYGNFGPHPFHTTFQSILNNIGYPSQNGIRNVAILNGALDGSNQFSYFLNNGQPFIGPVLRGGNKILDKSYIYILANLNLNVWTNKVDTSTKVFQGASLVFFPPSLPSFENLFITRSINYDRLSGGLIYQNFGNIPIGFSFVPSFSAIDYRGPLITDNDHNFSINNLINSSFQVINTALTPFSSIYGNDRNDTHSFSEDDQQAFNDFAKFEFGISNPNSVLASCVSSLPDPDPLVRIIINPKTCYPRNPREGVGCSFETTNVAFPGSVCRDASITYRAGYIPSGYPPNTFDKFIRITGTSGYVNNYDAGIGTILFNMPAGTYNISNVIRYYTPTSRNQILPTEKSSSSVIIVRSNCRIPACSQDNGDFIMWLNDVSQPVYAFSNNNIDWYAMLNNGTFIPQSQLLANGLDPYVASCFATSVETRQNGAWNNPNTWLTNFVPRYSDDIIIKSGHRVFLNPSMGNQNCHKAEVQTGAIFDCTGVLLMDSH
jgi:hypothetical protein